MAAELDKYANIKWQKPTRIERIASWIGDILDSKTFNRGFLILLAGMFLLTVGAQIYMRTQDTETLQQTIQRQTEVEKDLRLKNQILLKANRELSGNSVKLPAKSTWGLLHDEGVIK